MVTPESLRTIDAGWRLVFQKHCRIRQCFYIVTQCASPGHFSHTTPSPSPSLALGTIHSGKPPTVAFGPLNSDFPCRLSRVAGVVPDRLGCLNWWLRGNDRWSSLALACHHRRRGIAGVYHLDQSVVLVLRDGQVPGILYPDPVNSVLAPVGSIFRFPIFGSSSALGTVCAGRDGDEMLRIIEVVCVLLLSIGRPIPGAAAVGVLQRDHVVDVKFAGVGDERCWCRASATRLRRRDTSCRSGKQWSLGFELPRLRCGSPGSHHRRRSSASSRGGRTRGCWPGSWITFREGRSVPTYREQLQELSRGPYVLLFYSCGRGGFREVAGA